MIYGRSRKNPPYKYMTVGKDDSLGQTITVKKWLSNRLRNTNRKGE